MHGTMGFTEILAVSLLGLVRYGIPIAVAVWIILTLRRIRSEHEMIRSRLESIERLLKGSSQS